MGRARRALRSVPLSRLRFLTMANTAIDSVLLYNGNVLTLDDRDTVASGVLIEAGRISREFQVAKAGYAGLVRLLLPQGQAMPEHRRLPA